MRRDTGWAAILYMSGHGARKGDYSAERENMENAIPTKGREQKRVPLRRLRVVVSKAPERSRKQRTQNHPLDLATGRSGNFHGSKIRGKWAWTAKG